FLTQVGDEQAGVEVVDHRADRDADENVGAIAAGAVAAHSVAAVLGAPVRMILEMKEGVDGVVGEQDDVAAPAAVAAIGSALGNVLLAPEAHAPIAAFARTNEDGGLVDEHGLGELRIGDFGLGIATGSVASIRHPQSKINETGRSIERPV